jgi:beta-lactamase class A
MFARTAWFCLLFLPVTGPAAGAPKSLAELEASIKQRTEGQPGVYCVAFEDLSSGEKLLLHAEDRTHAASLMKVPVMMTVFHLVERGELDLERPVTVKNTFASLVDGSLFEVDFDPNGPLVAKAGEEVSLRELVRLMITRSDNVATDLVMELVGAGRVMELLARLGIEDVVVRRGVEDPKAYTAGLNNECSARGMLEVMVACRNSSLFRPQSRRQSGASRIPAPSWRTKRAPSHGSSMMPLLSSLPADMRTLL